jgi:hypothetical protein
VPASTATRLRDSRQRRSDRYLAPTVALTAAGVLLASSLFLPYWELTLVTSSEPEALRLVAFLDRVEGPLERVLAASGSPSDGPLAALSQLERSLALATGAVISLLVIAAVFVRNRWAALLALPAFCFPAIAVADTARWLRPILGGLAAEAGAPAAALPWAAFGRLAVGGTTLEIRAGAGLWIAIGASFTVAAGLWLHRRAYKPGLADESARAPTAA